MLLHADNAPRAPALAIERLYETLSSILPSGAVSRDPDLLGSYGADESGVGCYPPDLLVRPRTSEQVAEVVRCAVRHGVPIIPRGGGTGRAGGCVPIHGGLVLAMESMNEIVSIDKENMTVTAQSGVITGQLQEAVEAEGLFYGPDPSSLESCHIGGNVATNASGPRNPKYGPTRDQIRGLEMVFPSGQIIRTGGKTLKGVAGYDIASLVCGSEGTLAIITEVTLRLLPRPKHVETALLMFPSTELATRAVVDIMQSGHLPRAIEILDHVAVDALRGKAPFPFPEGEQNAIILELDGSDQDALFEELASIGERAETVSGASMVLVAQNESERRRIWASRRLLSPALRERFGLKYAEDIAVPLSSVPEIVDRIHDHSSKAGISSAVFGHAGDGNLHVNLLFKDESAWPIVMRVAESIFRDAVRLGGTITSEHGVGLLKRDFLPLEHPPALIELQRSIKRLLDPNDLLNPGKVLPAAS